MVETLLSGSAILMYGRVMDDITLEQDRPDPPPPGNTAPNYPPTTSHLNHLQTQLNTAVTDAQLARIYAVSYNGGFYTLAAPTIFLVHGNGVSAGAGGVPPGPPGPARHPGSADTTGVAAHDYDFSADMMVWTYDKNDISLRLDLSSGMLEDILLEAEFGDDMDHPSFGGGKVGGGKVGGGKVGGGKVGGGKVGGG